MVYSREEAITLLDLYTEPFDFGTGPMKIEDTKRNEDYLQLESLVQKAENYPSNTTLFTKHTSTLNSLRNRYKIDKRSKYRLVKEYKLGKRKIVGLNPAHEDYVKYLYKYENKKAKKYSKLHNHLKKHSIKKQRVEKKKIESFYVNQSASSILSSAL